MTRAWLVALGFLLAVGAGGAVRAEEGAPEKAVCRTCEIRGAQHGEEKVAASRRYEGRDYHFCSDTCAEAFDGFPDGYAVHPLPRPAPEALVTTMDGEDLALGAAGDRVVLIDFWATWCGPCKEAMPELDALHREYGPRGLSVVGVSIDEDARKVEKYLRRKPVGYATALDSKDDPAWVAYAIAAIPAMVLVDREGSIVGEWRGAVDLDEVRARIDAALAPAAP